MQSGRKGQKGQEAQPSHEAEVDVDGAGCSSLRSYGDALLKSATTLWRGPWHPPVSMRSCQSSCESSSCAQVQGTVRFDMFNFQQHNFEMQYSWSHACLTGSHISMMFGSRLDSSSAFKSHAFVDDLLQSPTLLPHVREPWRDRPRTVAHRQRAASGRRPSRKSVNQAAASFKVV